MFFTKRHTAQQPAKGSASLYAPQRGFSLVEMIVTAAIMSLVFGGLFQALQVMTNVMATSKAKAGALSLISERMEYIRSLPYSSVGTQGGVPSGILLQNSTTTFNGILYAERILIQYVDDPADGSGSADGNGILSDYIQMKVEYTWTHRGVTDSMFLVSNVVPPSIESTFGGGTIRVNVFDATAAPLAGAEVQFINNETNPVIDTIRYTDTSGVAYLSGAPVASNYQIITTDTGYSTDRTYMATTSNPNPATSPVAVLESQVSTMNFQIDQLSDLHLTILSAASYDTFSDTFTDYSLTDAYSNTVIAAEAFQLTDTAGVYDTSGSIQSTSTAPSSLHSWYSAAFNASTSAQSWVQVSVMYDNAGVLTRIPDEDLPGNSTGFQNTPIDITGLDVTLYPELALYGLFRTTDTAQTPVLYDWNLTYITSRPPISGVDVSIQGSKSIGTDGDAQPVLKYKDNGVSDSNGEIDFDGIEWDIYTIGVTSPGYSVYEVCPTSPYALNPGVTQEMKLTLGGASSQLLRVIVSQVDGTPVPEATVRLENTGVDQLSTTSLCGQSYFDSGLYNDDDYMLTVTAPGFTTEVTASTTVSSSSTVTVILN
jgi:prepilin-type N-terminal cleavage/methylation domain-containing protein